MVTARAPAAFVEIPSVARQLWSRTHPVAFVSHSCSVHGADATPSPRFVTTYENSAAAPGLSVAGRAISSTARSGRFTSVRPSVSWMPMSGQMPRPFGSPTATTFVEAMRGAPK